MSKIKAVIFDLDGTLYSNKKMKFYLSCNIITKLAISPQIFREIKTIRYFRKLRENLINHENQNLAEKQYQIVASKLQIQTSEVRETVNKWMFKIPEKYLPKCKHKDIDALWERLKEKQIPICIFSDYPVEDKLKALDLDYNISVCSTDKEIDALKPNPKGLYKIVEKIGVTIQECLFIGDRDDKDGQCARNAGMPYLIFGKPSSNGDKERYFSSYRTLERLF